MSTKYNNTNRMGRPPKYSYSDLEAVQKLHDDYGWGCLRISRQLGIPRNSVSNLLRILRTQSNGKLKPLLGKNKDIEHIKTVIYEYNLSSELYNILIKDRIKQLETAQSLINNELMRLKRFQLHDIDINPKIIKEINEESLNDKTITKYHNRPYMDKNFAKKYIK